MRVPSGIHGQNMIEVLEEYIMAVLASVRITDTSHMEHWEAVAIPNTAIQNAAILDMVAFIECNIFTGDPNQTTVLHFGVSFGSP